MKEYKIHKAWIMLAGACLLMINLSVVTTCQSFLITPISEELGFLRSSFTISTTIISIVRALTMPIWNKILSKIGLKIMISICSIMTFLGFLGMSLSTSLLQFYIISLIIGIFISGITMLPSTLIVNNWFIAKKGFAMGLVMSSSSMIGMILSPIIAMIVENYGWSVASMFIGFLVLVFSLPMAFVLKISPAQARMQAYGVESWEKLPNGQKGKSTTSGVSYIKAIKSLSLICVLSLTVLGSVGIMGLLQHIPSHLGLRGITTIEAGFMMSIVLFAWMLSKIGLGWLNDKLGTKKVILVSLFGGFVGLVLLTLNTNNVVITGALMCLALGMAFTSMLPPLVTSKMFGSKDYGSIYSLIAAASTIGYAIGTPLYGLSYDITGTYTSALYIGAILTVVAIVLVPISFKAAEKLSWDE